METSQQYTLFQLNEFLRRIVALNFPDALWITCEIAQISTSRGQRYLSLVEKEETGENIIARANAVLWAMDYRRLYRTTGALLDHILREGVEVRMQVKMDFHEQYGLKLVVQDIDSSYAEGKIALRRQQVIQELKSKGEWYKNEKLALPPVLQRIAVLSAEHAAGYQDYAEQVGQNIFGYKIKNQLFPIAVQGQQVATELPRQIERINAQKEAFDCVIIIRGGGARLDLMAFDELAVGQAIANCVLPVLTGIGHEVDETVADGVSHTSLKTPTAVAEFILQHNLQFESLLQEMGMQVNRFCQQQLQEQRQQIQGITQQLQFASQSLLRDNQRLLAYIGEELPRITQRSLKGEEEQLRQLEQFCQLLDPQNMLKRGFSRVTLQGKTITQADQLTIDDQLRITFYDGTVGAKVISEDE